MGKFTIQVKKLDYVVSTPMPVYLYFIHVFCLHIRRVSIQLVFFPVLLALHIK